MSSTRIRTAIRSTITGGMLLAVLSGVVACQPGATTEAPAQPSISRTGIGGVSRPN